MAMPDALRGRLRVPAIAAPMFLASGPDLVVEVCRSGLVGTFPALNQRTSAGYDGWLAEIGERLEAFPQAAPHGVNLIVHASNPRLAADLDITVRRRVPLVITSLGAVPDVVAAVHSYGGLVFHDVTTLRHAEKAVEAGVDGIIAVCAGAGGHGGALSPFALLAEIAAMFTGTLVLSGAISHGRQIAAARMMGCDLAYLGTRFLATREALVEDGHKRAILAATAKDIVYTPKVSGVAANFLCQSLVAAGVDPDARSGSGALDISNPAADWTSAWSAGQGVGSVNDIPPAAELCERLIGEYREAMSGAAVDPYLTRRDPAV